MNRPRRVQVAITLEANMINKSAVTTPRSRALLVCLGLAGLACVGTAQENSTEDKTATQPQLMAISPAGQTTMDPEAMKARMRAGMSMHLEQIKMRFEVMASPEIAERLARFSRAYYEALVQEGFSEREAMQLVVAVGIPSDR